MYAVAARGLLAHRAGALLALTHGFVVAEWQFEQFDPDLPPGLGVVPLLLSIEQRSAVVQRERVHKQLVETLRRVRQTRDNLSTTLTGEQLFQAIRQQYASELTQLTGGASGGSTSLLGSAAPGNGLVGAAPTSQHLLALQSSLDTVASDTPLPAAWDSRTTGVVSPGVTAGSPHQREALHCRVRPAACALAWPRAQVRNQGQCGTCVTFASTSTMEAAMAAAQQINGLSVDQLSPQWLYFCSGINPTITCASGMNLVNTASYVPTVGIQYETCFPYNPSSGSATCGTPTCPGALGPSGTWAQENYLSNMSGMPLDNDTYAQDIIKVKQHIVTWGSVAATFFVPDGFFGYSGGVFQQSKPWNTAAAHTVSVVGYNDTGAYWIVKNSWGPDWGLNGFFLLAYSGTALLTLDGVGFKYSTASTNPLPSAPPSALSTASMRCVATFYTGFGFSGDAAQLTSGSIQINMPSAQWTYPNLTFTDAEFNTSSWANSIRSYNFTCYCEDTGSCYQVAQGATWTYYKYAGLANTVPNPSGSVTLSTATCYGGALCTVADNMPGDFAAQTQSMAFVWTPQASGLTTASSPPPPATATPFSALLPPPPPLPPSPGAGPRPPTPNAWLVSTLTGLAAVLIHICARPA